VTNLQRQGGVYRWREEETKFEVNVLAASGINFPIRTGGRAGGGGFSESGFVLIVCMRSQWCYQCINENVLCVHGRNPYDPIGYWPRARLLKLRTSTEAH
jgi:hypothetical protein